MAVVLGWPGRMTDPAFGIDERLVVAGDLKVVLHRPLPPRRSSISRPRIREVIDKGPGNAAIIQITRDLVDADGTPVATVESSTFARKHGGFGGKVTETPAPAAVPDTRAGADLRPADAAQPRAAVPAQRRRESAACRSASAPRWRASSARSCTAPRASASRRMRSLRTCGLSAGAARQHRGAVLAAGVPGETIRTEMWPDGARVPFQCRVVGRGDIVLEQRARDA